MLPPDERYYQDPEFRALVDLLYYHIKDAKLTPTEIREAVLLAQIKYEMQNPQIRVSRVFPDLEIQLRALMK